jgi:DNA-binding NarL/FixJ family response regulator
MRDTRHHWFMAEGPAPERQIKIRTASQPIRVLVIDDDPRVLAAMSETIELEDDLTLIAQAHDYPTAIAATTTSIPEVVLVDVLLPDLATGLTLIRHLTGPMSYRVVAMSVRGDLGPSTLAAGASAFVEKSDDIDAVLNAVRGNVT